MTGASWVCQPRRPRFCSTTAVRPPCAAVVGRFHSMPSSRRYSGGERGSCAASNRRSIPCACCSSRSGALRAASLPPPTWWLDGSSRDAARGLLERVVDDATKGSTPSIVEAHPEVLGAVRAFLTTSAGHALQPCLIPVLPSTTIDEAVTLARPIFICPGCQRRWPPAHLAHAAWPVWMNQRPPAAMRSLPSIPGLHCRVEQPHWCVPLTGHLCAPS